MLLFGRVTYQMMASFWPTPDATRMFPVVAEGMNKADKVVFSRTLKTIEWNNTRLVNDNLVEEIRKMKQTSPKDMTILGSGSVVTQCAENGLIDSYQVMVDPVILGTGATVCKGISRKVDLRLTSTRAFRSGVVLLSYEPISEIVK